MIIIDTILILKGDNDNHDNMNNAQEYKTENILI